MFYQARDAKNDRNYANYDSSDGPSAESFWNWFRYVVSSSHGRHDAFHDEERHRGKSLVNKSRASCLEGQILAAHSISILWTNWSFQFEECTNHNESISFFQDGGLNTSGETENDIPKFISDNNDRTNYVRGKFLGKVKSSSK